MTSEEQAISVPVIPYFGGPKWVPSNSRSDGPEDGPNQEANNLRIIVVDDEVLIAETVVEILKEEGFDAVAVSSGEAAIQLAHESSPDIVLSDVIMPDMNGIEIGIKVREIAPACRVILFSGQAATVDLLANAGKKGHRFDILPKPIRPEALIAVIRKASGWQ